MRFCILFAFLYLPLAAHGAERVLDFNQFPTNQTPPGFRSAVAGQGKPGNWRVIQDTSAGSKEAVLAQLSQDATDEHFPLLVFEEETFSDFRLTTRFKTVGGVADQMAGIAFRLQNETNFYVIRASSLDNTLRFYKMVEGERGPLIGPPTPIPHGVWHDLAIECKGNSISCQLDGKEAMPALGDSSFSNGKIAFWTKSDSVSYFGTTRIIYTPREAPAKALMHEMTQKYPRLVGLQIFVTAPGSKTTKLVASKNEADVGKPGSKIEEAVISQGTVYYGKEKNSVSVVMPLRDRNGEPIAAVRVIMKTFPGETEQTSIVRATPIVKDMQSRVRSLEDLW
ncbi:MAG: hypothetical protein C5B50_27570 [Verrucomicrobia bacterium]|nr:MAG: hypothetical protein C5B50_27570 [Verrucomicrobiota bacterium]